MRPGPGPGPHRAGLTAICPWNVAADALVRAVVFDGLAPDHPAVSTLLEVLAPIAEAELAYGEAADARMYQIGTDWEEDEPEFPEQDGPVFLLGACALVDATWAAVGLDSLGDILGVLRPALLTLGPMQPASAGPFAGRRVTSVTGPPRPAAGACQRDQTGNRPSRRPPTVTADGKP